MSGTSLDQVDPWRACRRELRLSGAVALDRMPRLAVAVEGLAGGLELGAYRADDAGSALYELCFQRDPQGRPIVSGRVVARLELICQRCLERVEIAVDAELLLGLVQTEDEGADLPDHLDPWLVVEDRVRPVTMVEDELLLAIPQVPRHPLGVCQARVEAAAGEDQGEAPERDHPFAVLAALKQTSVH